MVSYNLSSQRFKKIIEVLDLAINNNNIQKVPTITWAPRENLFINVILPQFLFITLLIRLVLKNKNNKEDNNDLWGSLIFFKDLSTKMKLFIIIVADLFIQKS